MHQRSQATTHKHVIPLSHTPYLSFGRDVRRYGSSFSPVSPTPAMFALAREDPHITSRYSCSTATHLNVQGTDHRIRWLCPLPSRATARNTKSRVSLTKCRRHAHGRGVRWLSVLTGYCLCVIKPMSKCHRAQTVIEKQNSSHSLHMLTTDSITT